MNWLKKLSQDNQVRIFIVFLVSVLAGLGFILKPYFLIMLTSACISDFKPQDYKLFTYSVNPVSSYTSMEKDVVLKLRELDYRVFENINSYNGFPSNVKPKRITIGYSKTDSDFKNYLICELKPIETKYDYKIYDFLISNVSPKEVAIFLR